MRELEVLGDGHLKLDWADRQEFFEQDLAEMVRSQLKRLIEQALVGRTGPLSAAGLLRARPHRPPGLSQWLLFPRSHHQTGSALPPAGPAYPPRLPHRPPAPLPAPPGSRQRTGPPSLPARHLHS